MASYHARGGGLEGGPGMTTIFVAITLALIVAVLVYLGTKFLRRNLDSTAIVPNTRKLFDQSDALVVDASKLPVTVNGQEYAVSFWMYLPDYQNTTRHKLVFRRTSDAGKIGELVVFMDKTTNKMYLACATSNRGSGTGASSDTFASDAALLDKVATKATVPASAWVTATIDYVPLQRWVHVACVVQDSLLSVFVDGDLYTVESLSDVADANGRPRFAGLQGDMRVGELPGVAFSDPLKGYVGRMLFFNYALTQRDVQRMYNSGPRGSSALGALGMADYGVRSPIYRLDDNGSK